MEKRICSKCGKEKELNKENFYWRNDTNDYRNNCRECVSSATKKFRQDNLELVRERDRTPERKESQARRARERRKANPEKTREVQREQLRKYKLQDPERYAEHSRNYIKNVSPEIKERIRERGKLIMRRKRLDPDFRQSQKIYDHKRRDRLVGKFTSKEWLALIKLCDGKCLLCGSSEPMTPDHIIPVSKGGYNIIQNIQPLCLDCNQSKFVKIVDYRPLWLRQIYCMR